MNAKLANLTKEIGRVGQSRQGSVVVTEKHGTFLKVTDQHWVTVNHFEAEGIRHDAGTGSRQCVD